MSSFEYNALPGRVVFGAGKFATLADEVTKLGVRNVLVICSSSQGDLAEQAATLLGNKAVGIFARATMHVPVEIANEARNEAQRLKADCCLVIGGGSTIGLGKAIALESSMPVVAIPTTYSGSEMTPIWGLTENKVKRTGRDMRVLPKTVIYDPLLTLSLPAVISATSGINAIAHCVEALYAEYANPVISLMCEEGIRALGQSLPTIVKEPDNVEARSQACYGAWLAGIALGSVGMALHHKLCHTLGGSFNLPHAPVHTVILPHVTRYNEKAAPEAMARIAKALGTDDAAGGLFDLARSVGAKLSLQDLGMKESDLDKAAELATTNAYYNPRPVTLVPVRALLQSAWEGTRP